MSIRPVPCTTNANHLLEYALDAAAEIVEDGNPEATSAVLTVLRAMCAAAGPSAVALVNSRVREGLQI
jgi:hypothetical protein